MALFERANLVRVAQDQPNVVKAIEQAMFPERVDFEGIADAAIGGAHSLPPQVNDKPKTREGIHLVEQVVHLRLSQHDRQQSVLEAVVEEDFGETRSDHCTEGVLQQCPGRMLAG